MARIKRKYIDSHWLVFAVQGALALCFGWVLLFSSSGATTSYLISIVGVFLLALGLVELFNILHRENLKQGWAVSLVIALADTIVAMALLMTMENEPVWHLVLIAGYTLIRGVFELAVGLKTPDDLTDRFIWVLVGACGIVMGLALFNSGNMGDTYFVRFFGAYMMVLGVSSLIYSAHNHEQKLEDSVARKDARDKARKTVQTRKAGARKAKTVRR